METCEIEATVPSGLEWVAKEEVWLKLGINAKVEQGRVLIHLPVTQVRKVLELRCIDHLYVVILRKEEFDFASSLEDVAWRIEDLVLEADWSLGLRVWSEFISFRLPVSPHPHDKWKEIKQEIEDMRSRGRFACTFGDGNNQQLKNREVDSENHVIGAAAKTEDCLGNGVLNIVEGGDKCNIDSAIDVVNSKRSCSVKDEKNNLCTNLNGKIGYLDTTEEGERLVSNGVEHENRESRLSSVCGLGDGQTDRYYDPRMPRYRVRCYRTGKNHCFKSENAATFLGGRMHDYFGWNVDLKNYDIETILNIKESSLYVTIALTKKGEHLRNTIIDLAKVTLRPTICAGMLRMCRIKTGDIVCDPMCGTGSVSVEGMLGHPGTFHIAGELEKAMVKKAIKNIRNIEKSNHKLLGADVFQWDVQNLPLRDGSVDVVISDLPFGKRSGSQVQNWTLYPAALRELARVTVPSTGRACLLTQDKKCMLYSLKRHRDVWLHANTVYINHGGLRNTALYLLKRTVKIV